MCVEGTYTSTPRGKSTDGGVYLGTQRCSSSPTDDSQHSHVSKESVTRPLSAAGSKGAYRY
ncbi:hypothetical protein E2C01_007330 [Portunus trituberculatus]|uniref:Uncharacterized protein n=1 Tax=Portunus trituberculatus TaxID=210409 RepID=A0A5B7CXW9_PORTR|nr:hypothetical protein [Portunus trituberculatus]